MKTINAVPNLSQKPDLDLAIAAPSGIPVSREIAMLISPI